MVVVQNSYCHLVNQHCGACVPLSHSRLVHANPPGAGLVTSSSHGERSWNHAAKAARQGQLGICIFSKYCDVTVGWATSLVDTRPPGSYSLTSLSHHNFGVSISTGILVDVRTTYQLLTPMWYAPST